MPRDKIRARITPRKGRHTDDSPTAGERGPTLIEDFYFHEKISRFDRERIPERVAHAPAAGAHGVFTCTDPADRYLDRILATVADRWARR